MGATESNREVCTNDFQKLGGNANNILFVKKIHNLQSRDAKKWKSAGGGGICENQNSFNVARPDILWHVFMKTAEVW